MIEEGLSDKMAGRMTLADTESFTKISRRSPGRQIACTKAGTQRQAQLVENQKILKPKIYRILLQVNPQDFSQSRDN